MGNVASDSGTSSSRRTSTPRLKRGLYNSSTINKTRSNLNGGGNELLVKSHSNLYNHSSSLHFNRQHPTVFASSSSKISDIIQSPPPAITNYSNTLNNSFLKAHRNVNVKNKRSLSTSFLSSAATSNRLNSAINLPPAPIEIVNNSCQKQRINGFNPVFGSESITLSLSYLSIFLINSKILQHTLIFLYFKSKKDIHLLS
jgi:hypothetical protein